MLYLLEGQSRFPHRVQGGTRAVAWSEQEVQRWIQKRTAGRCGVGWQWTLIALSRALASWPVHPALVAANGWPYQ